MGPGRENGSDDHPAILCRGALGYHEDGVRENCGDLEQCLVHMGTQYMLAVIITGAGGEKGKGSFPFGW